MFLITRDTLRRFSLSEILLFIAMNQETSRCAQKAAPALELAGF